MQPQGNPPPYTPPGYYPHPQEAQPIPPSETYIMSPPGTQVIHATVIPRAVPTMVVGQQMGTQPSTYTCKSCNLQIITRVETRPTMRTHLFAALLCLFGCWPCACVPYCVDSCNNIDHYCPNCSAYIGTYVQ